MSVIENDKRIKEISDWYYTRLNELKKYSIKGGRIADTNTRIIMGIYTYENLPEESERPVNLETFKKSCLGMDLGTKNWVEYVNNFSTSQFGTIIFKASASKSNVFDSIVSLPRETFEKLLKEYLMNNVNDQPKKIQDSLELVLMNAVRYYYVHASLAEIISNIECSLISIKSEDKLQCKISQSNQPSNSSTAIIKPCDMQAIIQKHQQDQEENKINGTKENKEETTNEMLQHGFPCIIRSTGTTDATSDYDLNLYMYIGDVSIVVDTYYNNAKLHWDKESADLFDTNIYTSSYLLPIRINSNDNNSCTKTESRFDNENILSTDYKCSAYVDVNCDKDNMQLAYALYHLLEMTDEEDIDNAISTVEPLMRYLQINIESLYSKVNSIINSMIMDYERSNLNKSPVINEPTAKGLHRVIETKITADVKKNLYKFYTEKLFKKIKEDTNQIRCDNIAKINICMPETYYTYGALVIGVIVGQMKYNIIMDTTKKVTFLCAFIEDYAYVMHKLHEYKHDTDQEYKDAKYIGKIAKYVWRMLHSLYMIKTCKFTLERCTNNIIEEIKKTKNESKKEIVSEELNLAFEVIKLKQLKDDPKKPDPIQQLKKQPMDGVEMKQEKEKINLYDVYRSITGSELNTFKEFIEWIEHYSDNMSARSSTSSISSNPGTQSRLSTSSLDTRSSTSSQGTRSSTSSLHNFQDTRSSISSLHNLQDTRSSTSSQDARASISNQDANPIHTGGRGTKVRVNREEYFVNLAKKYKNKYMDLKSN
jgi:hypothetical protein